MASKKQRFRWTHRHDDVLIRELFLFEPWSTSEGSKERGLCWNAIAESLNQIEGAIQKV